MNKQKINFLIYFRIPFTDNSVGTFYQEINFHLKICILIHILTKLVKKSSFYLKSTSLKVA